MNQSWDERARELFRVGGTYEDTIARLANALAAAHEEGRKAGYDEGFYPPARDDLD